MSVCWHAVEHLTGASPFTIRYRPTTNDIRHTEVEAGAHMSLLYSPQTGGPPECRLEAKDLAAGRRRRRDSVHERPRRPSRRAAPIPRNRGADPPIGVHR